MKNMSIRITNAVCIEYFNKKYDKLNQSQKTFIGGTWAGIIWYELKQFPMTTMFKFMNKYTLRIKLNPYK